MGARRASRREGATPPRLRSALPAITIASLAWLVAGCGDGAGSSASGGTGGSGGSGGGGAGGGGGTTTTTTIAACPIGAEAHVAAVIVGPDSQPFGQKPADVTGTLAAFGVDTPPSPVCGSGQAWVQIEVDAQTTWIACFQAPSLIFDLVAGDAVTLLQTANEHPIAPASIHTTLRANGNLVLHVEQATYEAEVALPDGVTVAKGDKECASPDDLCKVDGYAVVATAGPESVTIAGGESGDAGGFRVYVDRYWTAQASSGCDGGDANILLSVTPSPGI